MVTRPMEGHKKEGTVGLLKGVGKGSVELFTKPGSGKQIPLQCEGRIISTDSQSPNSHVRRHGVPRAGHLQELEVLAAIQSGANCGIW